MFCGEVFTIGNTCLTTKKIINAICALRIFKKGAHANHTNIKWNLLFVKCCDACWRPKLQISHTTIWLTPVGYTYRFTFARVDPPERWPFTIKNVIPARDPKQCGGNKRHVNDDADDDGDVDDDFGDDDGDKDDDDDDGDDDDDDDDDDVIGDGDEDDEEEEDDEEDDDDDLLMLFH